VRYTKPAARVFECWLIIDQPQSGVVYNFSRLCRCLYVCLSLCQSVCRTITLESLDLGILYLHIRYISTGYGSSSYIKVIGLMLRSQKQKKSQMPIHALINFGRQFLLALARWRRRPRLAVGRALD